MKKERLSTSWQTPLGLKFSILILIVFVVGIIVLGRWFVQEYVKIESGQEIRAEQINKLIKN